MHCGFIHVYGIPELDRGQLIKDILTFNVPSFRIRWDKLLSMALRKWNGQKPEEVKWQEIPVVINNRNRYSYLLQLISWLENAGMKHIIILDNDSTYPPVLEYYKTTVHQVIKLGENVGHLALWKSHLYGQIRSGYYIYTDPDLVPDETCPSDLVRRLLEVLKLYPQADKVGAGLKIDDLPDHFAKKPEVLSWEKKFWEKEIAPGVFDAEVDTTFALYRPYTNGALWVGKALRTGTPYVIKHLPWYENSADPDEESRFYADSIRKGSSHWTEKK